MRKMVNFELSREQRKISMRGLLVDPILNSPHKYHKNIMTDSKRITTQILGVKGLKQKYHREPMKTQRKHRKLYENQKNGSKNASHSCLISVNLKVSWKKIKEKCNEVSHYLLIISPCHPPGVTKMEFLLIILRSHFQVER